MDDKGVALVTGANQGIGLQIARDLVIGGLTVLMRSPDFAPGQAAARDVGQIAHAIQLDVTDQASIVVAAERVRTKFGRLDVLIQYAVISAGITASSRSRRATTSSSSAVISYWMETLVFFWMPCRPM